MNVQEELLREKIDPWLTDGNLSALATEALGVRTQCDGYAVLTGGMWNRVIAVATDGGKQQLVIKITPKIGDADLKREHDVLRYFRDCTAMPVPEPFLLDLTGARIPGSLLVMEKVPGTVLHQVYDDLTAEERAAISTQLAEQLLELHAHRDTGFGGVETPPAQRAAVWLDFWQPRYDATIAESAAKGAVPDDLLFELSDIRRYFPSLLDIGPTGTLTHYDIWTGNVMVALDGKLPRVTAYLDLLGYYADYARELSSMFQLADDRFKQVYRQRHGLDASFEARFSLYTLKMCLQLVNIYPNDPRRLDDARRHLRQLQAFLGGG